MDIKGKIDGLKDLEAALTKKSKELTVIDEKALAAKLKESIIGQDVVIEQIATHIRRRVARKGLGGDKPIAVFCFAGPPGVGKSELAKVLADALYQDKNHLHVFSFAELGRGEHAASLLFGSPPDHVGQEGSVTTALRRIPNSVVLLDEIEKGHPNVLKRFLNAWNDGVMTDQRTSQKSQTKEAIFILTTNANQHQIGELAENHTGTVEELNEKVKDLLSVGEYSLAPEVLSRIDNVFAFRPMKGIDLAYIVALQMQKLARNYGLEIADDGIESGILLNAVEALTKKGTKGGVREIARKIEDQVADGLIDARQDNAKTVRFVADGDKVKVIGVQE